jgi:hypothetical protein
MMRQKKMDKAMVISMVEGLIRSSMGYNSRMIDDCVEGLNHFLRLYRKDPSNDNLFMLQVWAQTLEIEKEELKHQTF